MAMSRGSHAAYILFRWGATLPTQDLTFRSLQLKSTLKRQTLAEKSEYSSLQAALPSFLLPKEHISCGKYLTHLKIYNFWSSSDVLWKTQSGIGSVWDPTHLWEGQRSTDSLLTVPISFCIINPMLSLCQPNEFFIYISQWSLPPVQEHTEAASRWLEEFPFNGRH